MQSNYKNIDYARDIKNVWNEGIKTKDIKAAEMVLEENKELAIEKWNEYFGKSVKDEDF